jgi:hypothetical protein
MLHVLYIFKLERKHKTENKGKSTTLSCGAAQINDIILN